MLARIKQKSNNILQRIIGDFRESAWLREKTESFSSISPWLDFVDEHIVLMRDGSGVAIFKIRGIEHEVDEFLCEKVDSILASIESIVTDNVIVQFQFESYKSDGFDVPSWALSPKNFMQYVYNERVKFIQSKVNCPTLPLKQHTIHLILRYEPNARIVFDKIGIEGFQHSSKQYKKAEKSIREIKNSLSAICREIESSLQDAETPYKLLGQNDLLSYMRHTSSEHFHSTSYDESLPVSEQIMHDFVDLDRSAVKIGSSTWDCLSWLQQPSSLYSGFFSKLLKFSEDFRFTVNIRKGSTDDLDLKQLAIGNGEDAFSRLTKKDVENFQEDIQRDSKAFAVSVHAFVKRDGTNNGFDFATRLNSTFNIPFVVESRAAAGVWLLNLPGAYSSTSELFLEREKRCTSKHLKAYFPIFVGWQGTGGGSGGGMLMQSRAGNAVLVSPQDSQSGPHSAFCASSGGGKSVMNTEYKTSLLASRSDYMMNLIDLGVSYEIFAKVFGEHVGYEIITPPASNLNPFRGEMNDDRFLFLVDLLSTAVESVSGRKINNNEKTLLKFSISEAYKEQIARADESGASTVRSMRITDILNMMPYEAKKLQLERVVESLRSEFTILTNKGLYGHIFDQDEEEPIVEPPAPGITLYDLSGLSTDPIQGSLSVSVILGEIFRQTSRKANAGRFGSLDVEEVGILAKKYPALSEFAQEAWKRFRKANISCTGLTNDPTDYATLALGKAIWSQSENTFFLKMKSQDATRIVKGEPNRFQPLLEKEHLSRTFLNLKKVNGEFADILFTGHSTGTFCFSPNGFNCWIAANKDIEKSAFYQVSESLGDFYPNSRALLYLAKHFPKGARGNNGEPRLLTTNELSRIDPNYGLEELKKCTDMQQ